MEHQKELEDLNKKSLEKIDEYLKTKENLGEEHHEKLNDAKKKWQVPGPILWMFLCIWKDLKYEVATQSRVPDCNLPATPVCR